LLRTRRSARSTIQFASSRERFELTRPPKNQGSGRAKRLRLAQDRSAPLGQSARVEGRMRVLVSGSSGPIGTALLPSLEKRGWTVTRLVRGSAGSEQIGWNPAQALSPDAVSGFDAVVHLAGETIVGRWTEAKRRRILESRSQGTRHLAEAVAKASPRPRVFISASAVGYYGNRGDEILREESPSGSGFLAEVCRLWKVLSGQSPTREFAPCK